MGTQLEYVRQFRDLEVYKRQRELARQIFILTKQFPREEMYSLTDQLRRSSRSIGAQLAEAWAKRLYPKHFLSKLSDADGEQMETLHWIMEAEDCGYLDSADAQRLRSCCEKIGRMLGAMIRKFETFISKDSTLREENSPYLTEDHGRDPEY
jgi:four helix bundle protein